MILKLNESDNFNDKDLSEIVNSEISDQLLRAFINVLIDTLGEKLSISQLFSEEYYDSESVSEIRNFLGDNFNRSGWLISADEETLEDYLSELEEDPEEVESNIIIFFEQLVIKFKESKSKYFEEIDKELSVGKLFDKNCILIDFGSDKSFLVF